MRQYRYSIYSAAPGAVLAIIIALALSSCGGDSLEATVEGMRDAACRGDVEGFMSHVDKDAVLRNERRQEIRAAKESEVSKSDQNLPDGILGEIVLFIFEKMYVYDYYPLMSEETRKILKDTSRTLGGYFWEDIESEIKEGKDSPYCSFTVAKANHWSGNVTIRFGDTSKEAIWGFENNFGKWKLARLPYSYEGVEAVSDPGPLPTPSSDSDAMASAETAQPEAAGESVAEFFRHYDGYDFRKTRWGMTPNEVMKSEDSTIMTNFTINHDGTPNEDGSITYVTNIDSYGVKISYSFKMNKLAVVYVDLNKDSSSREEHAENYNDIRETIIKTYGQPIGEEITPDDKSRFKMFSYWKTNRTVIDLSLSDVGDKEFLFIVTYGDREYLDRKK